jgi:hypothetical protein
MAEKQKVLHVVEAMGGGVFTYIVELANGMSDEFDITIAFGIRSETPENYEEYFKDNINLIRVENFERAIRLTKDIKAYFELHKIIKKLNPDIIHLHSSKAGAIGRMIPNPEGKKMFYTPHGYSFLMEDISALKKHIYRFVEKMCGRRNCTTVACGKGEWEESKKVSKKSTYISNGIDTQKIDKIMEGDMQRGKNHQFTVYTVGRINYQKNPEMFNEIAKLVPNARFIWIGDGDMRNEITEENISVTGWLSGENALEVAKNGDVFILPSRWEGLPISLLEAMYMKKICIVSDVVGNRDIIKNEITGYICHTAKEFSDKIKQCMETENGRIIQNAHQEVANHYNSEWLCNRYKELYKE